MHPRLLRFLSSVALAAAAVTALTTPLQAQWTTADETFTHSIEFTTPTASMNSADHMFTPVVTYNGSTYFVWQDDVGRPFVTKITNGVANTQPLDTNPDYRARNNDGHHRFSLGVDEAGYIHIAGDMHNYPGNSDHLPTRYLGHQNLYWVSASPQSISSFVFKGGSTSALPHYRISYGSFHNDMLGRLYWVSRIEVLTSNGPGSKYGVALSRYNQSTATWTALGSPLAPGTTNASDRKVILWEDNVFAGTGFYQAFMTSIRFDKNNRLHFAGQVNNDSNVESSTHVIYAYSDDRGDTWRKANGTLIPSLPLRVDSPPAGGSLYGGGSQGDILIGPHTRSDGQVITRFGQGAFVFLNHDNVPGATYSPITNTGVDLKPHYSYRTGSTWSASVISPVAGGTHKIKHYLGADGILTYTAGSTLYRALDFNSPGYAFTPFQGQQVLNIDERGLRETNVMRTLHASSDGKLILRKITFQLSWPNTAPNITTTSLAGGTVNTAYSQTLAATGGDGAKIWSLAAGTLPAGLTLASSTGTISGTPTTAGTFNFTVRVADSDALTTPSDEDTQALSILVAPSGGGGGATDYQAETGTTLVGANVGTTNPGYTGTGYVDMGPSAGTITWTVTAPSAGTYTLDVRYANGSGANRPGTLAVNGGTAMNNNFAATASWTTWGVATFTASLNSGTNTVVLSATNGPNIDKLTVTPALPSPWASQDIGAVGTAGSTTHASGTFTAKGAGADIWGTADAFHFAHQTMTGDGSIVARVTAVQNTDGNAKAGVMIRESLNANSAHALINLTPASGAQFIRRTTTGGTSTYTAGPAVTAPYWVRLVRTGNTFTASVSPDGASWSTIGSPVTITMASSVKVGLAVVSKNTAALNTSTFTNVTVVP